MARTEVLPKDVLEAIAAQIGQRIGQMVTAQLDQAERAMPRLASTVRNYASGGKSPSVGESFSFWMLDPSSLSSRSDDLRALARNTGRWHHQITLPAGGTAYARSILNGDGRDPSNWMLRELFEADLSDRISEAIPILDSQVPDNYVARLLSVPAYQLNVLWLIDDGSGDQKAMVVTAPATPSRLAIGRLYDVKDFLAILRSKKPIQGLVDDIVQADAIEATPSLGLVGVNQSIDVRIQIRFPKPR